MGVPTQGECFARLVEHVRKAQEEAAMLAHLYNADGRTGGKDRTMALGWLAVSEQLKKFVHTVTEFAKGRLQ